METLWFCLVALMVALYVLFDGFDIGAGIVHMLVAKSDEERQAVIATIGPVWDGNEVWLLAAGGTLYFAFPALYASGFSGFYLPLMMVLWLLIGRGLSLELRSHVQTHLWKTFWDAVFSISSILLAIFFGAALGNVIRGVPLDSTGFFFLPLWTNFQPSGAVGILDWYTVAVGLAAFFALTIHGALWVALKTEGEIQERALRIVRIAWPGAAALTLVITMLSFLVQRILRESFARYPWGFVFPALALGGLIGIRFWRGKQFYASCAYLAGMLTSAVFGVYPYVLPSNLDPATGLDIHNASAPYYGLGIGLRWWIPGMILAAGYFFYVYRHFAGKVNAAPNQH